MSKAHCGAAGLLAVGATETPGEPVCHSTILSRKINTSVAVDITIKKKSLLVTSHSNRETSEWVEFDISSVFGHDTGVPGHEECTHEVEECAASL